MKTCLRCKILKKVDKFGIDRKRKDGRFPYCKSCRSIENKLPHVRERQKFANIKHRKTPSYKKKMLLHNKQYRDSRKGKLNREQYVEANKEKLKLYMKEYSPIWQNSDQGRESLRKARQKYYYKDVEKSREYQRRYYQKRKQKIEYRINDAVSSNIYCALKDKKAGRSWEIVVGYTLSDLMHHLQSLFVDGKKSLISRLITHSLFKCGNALLAIDLPGKKPVICGFASNSSFFNYQIATIVSYSSLNSLLLINLIIEGSSCVTCSRFVNSNLIIGSEILEIIFCLILFKTSNHSSYCPAKYLLDAKIRSSFRA